MSKKRSKKIPFYRSLKSRLMLVLVSSVLLILVVNVLMFYNISRITRHLDEIYAGNQQLTELEEGLELLQESVNGYLNTKSTDTMQEYYICEQEYTKMVEGLTDKISDDPLLLMERNVKKLSESYLKIANLTIEAKRGRNVEKYRSYYEQSKVIYQYLTDAITSLNTLRFRSNTGSYEALSKSLVDLEQVSIFVFLMIAVFDVVLVIMVTGSITGPLLKLSEAANRVSEGDLENATTVPVSRMDEVGVVTVAFNQMVTSIPEYIKRLREGMEMERELKEKELLMEAHLKDARLKYLQAQINPHFLFNTLNAGAQLAMLERADRTYDYVQNVADFFRYNIRKDNDEVPLRDEIALVDTYIYILNVRFSGEIHFEKEIEEDELLRIMVPGMILQPIVENSVNYGIRDIERPGKICLQVAKVDDRVRISIKDNGKGMTPERIGEVLSGEMSEQEGSGNGIGLFNVMQRLHLYFDDQDSFEIISDGPDQGTEVAISVPVKRAMDEKG
ncbi:MAG: histidine kinase [Lachnospiraceae bacterium]|nr:histidine kinase [Lachnospiraceae bacterium]